MAYTAWSVVFGEQPTAAKWNQLGENDAGFRDGTNIDDDVIIARHISAIDKSNLSNGDANPYKFSAYRNSALTTGTSNAAIVYDTEVFDTNSNFDTTTGRYTAPVDGYYFFSAGAIVNHGSDLMYMGFYRNGTEHKRFKEIPVTVSGNNTNSGSALIYLTAGQYVDVRYNSNANRNFVVGNQAYTWFSGFLISRT